MTTDRPPPTIGFNEAEVVVLLGAVGTTLNLIGQQLRDLPDDGSTATTESRANYQDMMGKLEALQTRIMNADWTQ